MRRGLIILLACIGLGQVSFAQSFYEPPPPGTLLSWSYQFDGDGFSRLSEIVATGDDFVIYDPDLQFTQGSTSRYVVEFSGVHAQSCDEPMLGIDDRRALRAMWPLIRGASATVRSGGVETRYEVGDKVPVYIVSQDSEAMTATRVEGRFGDADMEVLVSDRFSVPVALSWAAGGGGRVLEVVEPQGSAGAPEIEGSLGRCAELLQ